VSRRIDDACLADAEGGPVGETEDEK
jgi:hypothetical protein